MLLLQRVGFVAKTNDSGGGMFCVSILFYWLRLPVCQWCLSALYLLFSSCFIFLVALSNSKFSNWGTCCIELSLVGFKLLAPRSLNFVQISRKAQVFFVRRRLNVLCKKGEVPAVKYRHGMFSCVDTPWQTSHFISSLHSSVIKSGGQWVEWARNLWNLSGLKMEDDILLNNLVLVLLQTWFESV